MQLLKTTEKLTAIQKMQQISERLISNTPQLAKHLDNNSILKKNDKKSGKKEVNLKEQLTSNDYLEKYNSAAGELEKARMKCNRLENDLDVYKQRFVQRQIEYRKIIEELQQQLRSKISLDGNEKIRMQQIFDLHGRIQDNITSIQTKTSKILVQQQSDIIKFFHKKINQIKEKFKQERLSKGEKDQQFLQKQKQLVSELDWIKNIAQKIDNQNQSLLKRYNQLKSQFQIQQNDRQMVIKQLFVKNRKNATLLQQVEKYQKALQQLVKQPEQPYQDKSSLMTHRIQESYDQTKALNTIKTLKQTLAKEQKKAKQFKNLYVEQIQNKSQLQKILRQIVDDIKGQTIQLKIEGRRKKQEQGMSKQDRDKILQKLMNQEKILNLIYDKTFYPDANARKGEINLNQLSLD